MSSVAAVEITCPDVAGEVDHFVSLGWRIVDVFPADDPHRITVHGNGLGIVVVRGEACGARVHVPAMSFRVATSPNGTEVVFGTRHDPVPSLVSSPVVSLANGTDAWHIGRAGMHYRDLVPDRQGGAVIASHIRIPHGGPVPDYPHFHEVVFQLIFCHRGWVRLAYESQGEPFVLHAGECVIQPPRIRHRVLESSDDLHVVEVGYPAEHLTIADHDFDFTRAPVDPLREWDSQRFVRHTNGDAEWLATPGGAEVADTGIATATVGRADVRVVRLSESDTWTVDEVPDRRFHLIFVLEGDVHARIGDKEHDFVEADAAVVPVRTDARLRGVSAARLLSVVIDTD